MWIPILLGVLFAFLILWYLNRQVSYFNSGLGDRMQPQEPVAPPPMAAVERVMNQQDEYQWKRVKIEGTDALLVGVGLEQWHGESKSIMDGAQPGSMADWLRVHETGPPPGEPQPAMEKDAVKQESMGGAESSTPWSSGGMSGGMGGGYTPSSAGGFSGGFMTTMSVPASSPGAPPSAAQMQQQALDAWKAQQQVGADAAAQQAQQAAVQTQVNYFTTMYNVTWLPSQTVKSDTPANRSSFVTQQTQTISTAMSTTPLNQTAVRTQLYNQMQALQNMAAGWSSGNSPAPRATPAPAPRATPAPAPTSTLNIAGTNWKPFLGNDYPGNDLQFFPTKTRAQCASECASASGCRGFVTAANVTDANAGPCVLKNAWVSTGLHLETNLNAYQKS